MYLAVFGHDDGGHRERLDMHHDRPAGTSGFIQTAMKPQGKTGKGTHGGLLAPGDPPTAHATRSLRMPALAVYPTCPCSPPAYGPWTATRRPGQPQDARLNSRRLEKGKRAGRKLRNATVPARLYLRAREFSRHLVLATPADIPEDGVARAAHIAVAVPA